MNAPAMIEATAALAPQEPWRTSLASNGPATARAVAQRFAGPAAMAGAVIISALAFALPLLYSLFCYIP